MSIYISPNNEYPRYVGDIQVENPDFELGNELPDGWKIVADVDFPDVSGDNLAEEQFPILDENNNYVRNFVVRPMTEDEIAAKNAPALLKKKLNDLGLSDAELIQIRLGLI